MRPKHAAQLRAARLTACLAARAAIATAPATPVIASPSRITEDIDVVIDRDLHGQQ